MSLPWNLRFSILDAMPENDIRKNKGRPYTSDEVEAIIPFSRVLWEEGI